MRQRALGFIAFKACCDGKGSVAASDTRALEKDHGVEELPVILGPLCLTFLLNPESQALNRIPHKKCTR